MRVLIAEDDIVSRRILETLLRNWGHEVVTTFDGDQAWQTMRAPDAPALAILDVMMPGLTASRFAAACASSLRQHHRTLFC